MPVSDNVPRIERLREIAKANPGGDEFVELARLLADNSRTRSEAREVCFRGLAVNPTNLQGRLVLARLFYLDELGEFCVRELVELRKYSKAPALDKLLAAFGDFAKPFLQGASIGAASPAINRSQGGEKRVDVGDDDRQPERVVAEIDLDFNEAFEEIDK